MASAHREPVPPLTLGTAGHIDHGKTALIAALTGKNTDRLEQEQRRGISIELGYAELELPSGRRISVVDVPGHERFVRTMISGASGIDFYLLCIAADDGVMPQTREHLTVLGHLGIDQGVVCVTKQDIGEPELAAEEARELVPDAEVVCVSALERSGIAELCAALDRAAARLPGRSTYSQSACGRLFVDRSFTLRGIGTVVTGTLWSGGFERGEQVMVLPRRQKARVRSVQVHDHPVDTAVCGQRVALNLAGVSWRDVGRGDTVLCEGATGFAPSYLLDAKVTLEAETPRLKRGARISVHHGTLETAARVVSLEGQTIEPSQPTYAQLRLERPAVASVADRLVLRQLAPADTIGGGTVIDAKPSKHGVRRDVVTRLRALERGEPPPQPAEENRPATSQAPRGDTDPGLDEAARTMGAVLRSDWRQPRTDAELASACGLHSTDAQRRLRLLVQAGQAVRVGRNLHFDAQALAELSSEIVSILERDGATTIAQVRDELATSRKYAQSLLEHLDATKVTVRRGDEHVLRAKHQ